MKSAEEIEKLLTRPIDPTKIMSRKGRGGSGDLSYLATHEVIRQANAVFGRLGWSCTTVVNEIVAGPLAYDSRGERRVEYVAKAIVRVEVIGHGTVADGTGVGNGQCRADGGHMDAIELALKEAESDAKKRALFRFGDPLGLALYDKDQSRVPERMPKEDLNLDNVRTVEDLNQVWASLPREERNGWLDRFAEARSRIMGGADK